MPVFDLTYNPGLEIYESFFYPVAIDFESLKMIFLKLQTINPRANIQMGTIEMRWKSSNEDIPKLISKLMHKYDNAFVCIDSNLYYYNQKLIKSFCKIESIWDLNPFINKKNAIIYYMNQFDKNIDKRVLVI
jgi:hypothetical protein